MFLFPLHNEHNYFKIITKKIQVCQHFKIIAKKIHCMPTFQNNNCCILRTIKVFILIKGVEKENVSLEYSRVTCCVAVVL